MATKSENIKELSIKLIASPNYVMVLTTQNKTEGLDYAKNCLKAVEQCIIAKQREFQMKNVPHFINDQGDIELEELIRNQGLLKHNTSALDEDRDEGMDVDLGIYEAAMDARDKDDDEKDTN